jgi:threonine aldolase
MADAVLGDDVLDGDPTTAELERRVADLLGHETALFFPTGTQANQTAIAVHVRPGTEIVLDAAAHIVHYEKGGAAALWGAQLRPVPTDDGVLTAAKVEPYLRAPSVHLPHTALLVVENTHNAAGGTVLDVGTMMDLAECAAQAGVPLHVDGARLWNAALALGVEPRALAAGAASVMVSFSKGLGCPVGSVLALPWSLRPAAVEVRRRLGGGMRQSGVLAAACIYALDHHRERLHEDHHHARALARALENNDAVSIPAVQTNIVMLDLRRGSAQRVEAALRDAGVLVSVFGPARLRVVMHLGISAPMVDRAAAIIGDVLAGVS